MKKKHIVQISSYYPPHLGGQENAVHDLAQQLANVGHKVHVLASSIGGGQTGTRNEQNVVVTRMRGKAFGHAPIMPWFPVALFRTAKQGSVVHLHVGQAFTPEMVWLLAKLRGFTYIAQLHIDFEPSGPVGFLLPLYKRFILKRVLHSAAAVIVLNEKTLKLVRKTYGYKGKAGIINNGLDESFFALQRPPLKAQPPKTLRLLFVGRLSKQKNVPELLKAVKLTKYPVKVDIIGEGEEYETVRQTLAELGLTNVTLHGRLKREEVMEFYKNCDALIMPSLYEAQPLVLLEAMAARIPIIGTRVIGVAEHLKDGGIIVEPTAQSLAKGIEQYFTEYHNLPTMVERAYRNAESLRWKHTLKKYEELYDAVAN